MSGEFDGQVVVVTGGSRGIGRAIAAGFAAEGANVVIASRKLENCQAVAVELEEAFGMQCLAVAYHAGRWSDSDRLAEETLQHYGRCDVLINNAGMSPHYEGLETITEAYYDKVAAVNLKGPFRLSVRLGSAMVAAGAGSIINVSTIGSLRPGADEIVYACAKAGLNALTVALAGEYGPSVRVNGLLPGAVETDIAVAWSPETRAEAERGVPLQRIGQPTDFVGPALWLASARSAYVTGTLTRVDGGRFRQMS